LKPPRASMPRRMQPRAPAGWPGRRSRPQGRRGESRPCCRDCSARLSRPRRGLSPASAAGSCRAARAPPAW
jgi:hypothetical protein